MGGYKRKCNKCGEIMHKIGPFAKGKPEGQPAAKFDGVFKYQCTNADCPEYDKVLAVTAEDEATLEETMLQVCQCGHAREMHGYSLAETQDDTQSFNERKDKECSVTDCGCATFTQVA